MPFKSEKQRKWMWANEPEMAEKWEKEEDEKNEGNVMKITKRQLRRIIKEEKQKLLKEMIDPQYMREEILNLAEIVDEDGMVVIMELVEAPFNGNLNDAYDAVESYVTSATPETLKWLHDEITSEGLFDWYG
jgi:hypothetical protein